MNSEIESLPKSVDIIDKYITGMKEYKVFGSDVDDIEILNRAVLNILTYFENSPELDDWKEPATFIDGEFDSNQTKFEELSNQSEICVKSKSKIKGYVLLLFLRMIIDENYNMFFCCFDNEEEEKDIYTIHELIKIIGEQETSYTDIFPEYNKNIDVWDVKRIKNYYETHPLVYHKNKHGVNVLVTEKSLTNE